MSRGRTNAARTQSHKPEEIAFQVCADPPPIESTSTEQMTIYSSFDIANPPPRPSRPHTRLCLVSDTHNHYFHLPPTDVLIHSGDFTDLGSEGEVRDAAEWIGSADAPVKIVVPGNHDLSLHEDFYKRTWERWHYSHPEDPVQVKQHFVGPAAQSSGIIYLEDAAHEFPSASGSGKRWKVWGSPVSSKRKRKSGRSLMRIDRRKWQPEFGGWAWNYTEEEAEGIVSKIEPCDILITHGPARGILDASNHGTLCGCPALLSYLSTRLQPRLKLHVFGHIHEARGVVVRQYPYNPRRSNYPDKGESESKSKSTEVDAGKNVNETVHINASNTPRGVREKVIFWKDENKKELIGAQTGGFGWQPILVDLFD